MRLTSYYRLGVTIGGLAIFIAGIFCYPYPIEHIGIGIATALFVAFQINFPIRVLSKETTSIHFIALGVGVLYNFPLSLFAVTLGIVAGMFSRWIGNSFSQNIKSKEQWLNLGFLVGLNLIPLTFVWVIGGLNSNLLNSLISDTYASIRVIINYKTQRFEASLLF